MLRMTYNLSYIKKTRKSFGHNNKNYSPIEEDSLKSLMALQIPTIDNNGINDCYTKTISAIKSCVSKLPSIKKNRELLLVTPEIESLINERESLKNIQTRTKTQRNRLKYLHKKINKSITENKKTQKEKYLEIELEKRSSTKNTRKIFDRQKEWIQTISNSSETKITNRKDILQAATKFYSTLYSSKDNIDSYSNFKCSECIPALLVDEVERAIRQLKRNKSPGEDGVTTDTVIAMIEPLAPLLTRLFNDIVDKETIPDDWHYAIITLLYKKGDPNKMDNYRPISLLPTLYKLFSATILYRITKALDEQQPREQAGFRRGYSTVDHMFTLSQCIERYNEYNKTLYLAFIDYTKAFDSISHGHLWNSLEEQGIHEKYISILRVIYAKCYAKIKTEQIGPAFEIKRGIKQGDPVSPKMFTAILESMFKKLDWSSCGLNIDGERLTHLRFADDIVILAETHESLQSMLESLDQESRKIGLHMNFSKTKVMTNGEQNPVKINNTCIEYVQEYIYLGQILSFQDATAKEVDRRIATAWKKYWANKDVFKSRVPVHLKKRLMDNTILPTLLYGCQTWALSKDIVNKIAKFQRATERSMLGIKLIDKVKSADIRRKTKLIDAVKMLCRLKWKWAGHVARTTDNRWSERIVHWYPRDSTRTRGRQKKRWRDDITQVAGVTWPRLARDRTTWKAMEEAYTRTWVPL